MTSASVLVVEDNILIRTSLVAALQEAGFNVAEADDAASALAILQRSGSIALMCTDVQMPGQLDGVDLAKHVQSAHPQTRIILMSAQSQHQARLPSAPFLVKPFDEACLVRLAEQELARQQNAPPSARRPIPSSGPSGD